MSVMPPHLSDHPELQRVASILLAVKEYEGDGRIIHDSYNKAAYTKRRHGFLGRHPDFQTDPLLLPKVLHEADQVFRTQDELSVEKVRNSELSFEIEPLLPFPTSTNTQSLDNFRSTGTKEWKQEAANPHFIPSLQSSPSIAANEPSIEQQQYIASGLNPSVTFRLGLGEPVSAARGKLSSVGNMLRRHPQRITAGPDPETPRQQTITNTPSRHPSGNLFNHHPEPPMPSAMDTPRGSLNAPRDAATMQQIVNDLGKPYGSLKPSDAPLQYRQLETERQRLLQVSALSHRPLEIPVKSGNGGKKRGAPLDHTSGERQFNTEHPDQRAQPAAKKPKAHGTAGEDPVPEKRVRRPAAKEPRSAVRPEATAIKLNARDTLVDQSTSSSVSDFKSTTRRTSRPTLGGKAPPQQSGSATPAPAVPRRQSHPGVVNGNRMPKNKAEAADSAVERRQLLTSEALSKKKKLRHPDLGPEFFDVANFTDAERDPDGEPPVRCVCGVTTDIGNYHGEWIGCDNEECRVWQHVACMGEGVPPPNKRDTSKYLCQQCDAWTHRRLIQRLRMAQVLP